MWTQYQQYAVQLCNEENWSFPWSYRDIEWGYVLFTKPKWQLGHSPRVPGSPVSYLLPPQGHPVAWFFGSVLACIKDCFSHILDIKSHHYRLPFWPTCIYSHTRLSGWSIYSQEGGPEILVKIGTEPYPSNNVHLQCFEIETFCWLSLFLLDFRLLLFISNSSNNEEKSSVIMRLIPNMDHSLVILYRMYWNSWQRHYTPWYTLLQSEGLNKWFLNGI